MLLLVSGATAAVRRHLPNPHLGTLVVPGAGNRVGPLLADGRPWAADNAAYAGFDPAAFLMLLGRLAGVPGCRFAAVPDAVGDAAATARLFAAWEPVVRAAGLPVALVLQDGQAAVGVPWERLDAVFVGGSTAFKLGPEAGSLVREAKARGLWAHMGRVNTAGRFRHAHQLGCDSVDGSGFSRWPDQRLPLALGWLRDLHGDAPAGPAGGRFFRGGLAGTLVGGPGWAVDRVEETAAGYAVNARWAADPAGCPGCGGTAPDGVWLYRHGSKVTRVVDAPRHGRPVAVTVTRRRFRCGGCGHVFVPVPPGLQPGGRLTVAATEWVVPAAEVPAVDLAVRLGVTARTVRRIRARANGPEAAVG